MKKSISVIILSLVMVSVAKAQVVQRMLLKNGSVLSGYVQQAQDGRLTFHSEEAVVIVENANVEESERAYRVQDLDSAWVKWADKHDAFEGAGSGRILKLSNLHIKEGAANDSVASDPEGAKDFNSCLLKKANITKVMVLEKGKKMKYLEMSPNEYQMTWDDVVSIKTERRSKTALSGINCTYTLRTGEEFEGQPAEETKNTLSLYLEKGLMQTFDINDVVKYNFHGINPNQSIFAQSELLDVVKTTLGTEVEGIVIEQNYTGNKDEENSILIQQESGSIKSVKMNEFVGCRKVKNPQYAPQTDILLNEGDVVVNRKDMAFVNVKEEGDRLLLDSLCENNVVNRNIGGQTKVVVEYRVGNGVTQDAFQLIRLGDENLKKKPVKGFSYKDLVNNSYRSAGTETSVNQTTRTEYIVPGQGLFVLYDAQKKRAIPFVIR